MPLRNIVISLRGESLESWKYYFLNQYQSCAGCENVSLWNIVFAKYIESDRHISLTFSSEQN